MFVVQHMKLLAYLGPMMLLWLSVSFRDTGERLGWGSESWGKVRSTLAKAKCNQTSAVTSTKVLYNLPSAYTGTRSLHRYVYDNLKMPLFEDDVRWAINLVILSMSSGERLGAVKAVINDLRCSMNLYSISKFL